MGGGPAYDELRALSGDSLPPAPRQAQTGAQPSTRSHHSPGPRPGSQLPTPG